MDEETDKVCDDEHYDTGATCYLKLSDHESQVVPLHQGYTHFPAQIVVWE